MKKSIPKPETLLIIGLGNPGAKYRGTPHNAGFLAIELLSKLWNAEFHQENKSNSEIAEVKIYDKQIILVKPATFMNNSGQAVAALTKTYGLDPQTSVWLVHDDADLELGKIKIVRNRGSAGHKGVEDVIRKLQTKDFE